MIETGIFDICGVLWNANILRDQFLEEVSVLKQKSKQEVFRDYRKIYKDFEVGKKNPQDYDYIPFEQLNEILDRLYQKDNFIKYINKDVVKIINEIKASGKKVYCLSNLENFFGKFFKENIDQYFDKSFYSYEIQARKPDIKAFQLVLDDIDKKPHEVVFIDDTLINIDAAAKMGIRSILFSSAAQLQTELKK